MGGSETDPGIFINWSLRLGTTASRCITFNKFWPISRDLVFDIRILELWVVNEVFIKKRHLPKRDFYSTVVMWNKIGWHKAKEDRRADRRNCCFQNALSNGNHCSGIEIHETDEHHFEPSNTSLVGDNNADDELLIAIKNRLSGLPPMPGALSLKPEAKLKIPMTSMKPQHLANGQSSKQKKVPTQVSTQVDDNMITELRSQGTSTSHLKVTSRCTQSGIDLAPQIEGTAQLRHSTNRMQQVGEGYQRSLPQEKNVKVYQTPSRTFQSDAQYSRTLQPRRNSFPNHEKQRLPSPAVDPQANYEDSPPDENVIRNSIQSANQYSMAEPSLQSYFRSRGLPEVPDYYGMSSQRPSVTRSVRSSIDEAAYNQHNIHEVPYRNNMGAILPYQQLVRAEASRGDHHEETNLKPPSQSRIISREGPIVANREQPPTTMIQYQDHISSNRSTQPIGSYQDRPRHQDHQSATGNVREANAGGYSQYEYRPLGNTRENDSIQRTSQKVDSNFQDAGDRGSIMNYDSQKIQRSSSMNAGYTGDHSSYRSKQEEQTVLTVRTQQLEGSELCKCGSKELKLVCGCKKSVLRETEVVKTIEGFRECRCPKTSDCEEDVSKHKKKKKDKKVKPDKEAKAEEKRRKKEEKEREKKERARQKAREKEEKKKSKKGKKRKSKGQDCKMCSCCKCCGGTEGETTLNTSENGCDPEEKSTKKSKKEKKSKEQKEKKPKGKKEKSKKESPVRSCNCPPTPYPFRSCNCPPSIQTAFDEYSRLQSTQEQQVPIQSQQLLVEEKSNLGYCNHPDIPCPVLGKREASQLRLQNHKSVTVPVAYYCGDPVCTNSQRIRQSEASLPCYEAERTLPNCGCERSTGGCAVNVCTYATKVDQPAVFKGSTSTQGSNLNSQIKSRSRSPYQGSINSSDTRRYRDITAAPALIFPNDIGHGDTAEALPHLSLPAGADSTPLPAEFSTNENDVLINLSRNGRENSANKRYVPPCVLYLDCTKVKDLCVIIKDKYIDPS